MALQTLSQRTGRGDVCVTQSGEESSWRTWQHRRGGSCTRIAEQLCQQPWGCTLAYLLGWPASSKSIFDL